MKKNLFFVVLITTNLVSAPQESTYNAKAFIEKALDRSFVLKQSQLEVQQRQSELTHQSIWENPDLSVQFDDRLDDSMKLTGVEVAQKLPTYGAFKNIKGKNQAFLNRAEYMNKQMNLNIQYRAAMLYYELYYANQALELILKQRKEIEKLLKVASARQKAGEISGVIQTRIKIANAELLSKETTLKAERNRLHSNAQYLLQTNEKIVATALLKLPVHFEEIDINQDAYIQALREGLKADEYALLYEKSKRYPLPEFFAYKEREEGLQRRVEDIYGVGVRFSVPLWNQNRLNIERSHFQKQQSTLTLKQTESEMTYTWQQQKQRFEQLTKQVKHHQETILAPAKRFYETQILLFTSGENRLLELLDAQALYGEAQLQQNALQKERDIYQLNMMQTASIALVKDIK